MARVLVCESDPDVRRLLALLVERLGHEAVFDDGSVAPSPADLMLLEPASARAVEHARAVRDAQPGLPIICVSVLPEDGELLSLGPLEYLVKPFALKELRAAVDRALGLLQAA